MMATNEQATAKTRNASGKAPIHIRIHHGTWLSGDRLQIIARSVFQEDSFNIQHALDRLSPAKRQQPVHGGCNAEDQACIPQNKNSCVQCPGRIDREYLYHGCSNPRKQCSYNCLILKVGFSVILGSFDCGYSYKDMSSLLEYERDF